MAPEPVIHPYNPYSTVAYADDAPYSDYEPDCPSHEPLVAERADQVNRPLHYAYGKIEVIDFIMQTAVLYRGDQAVLVGNVLKYLARAPLKGNMKQDLEKASWYLNRLIETL